MKVEVFVLNNVFPLILKKSRSWTQYWSQKSLDSCLKNSGLRKKSQTQNKVLVSVPMNILALRSSEYVLWLDQYSHKNFTHHQALAV